MNMEKRIVEKIEAKDTVNQLEDLMDDIVDELIEASDKDAESYKNNQTSGMSIQEAYHSTAGKNYKAGYIDALKKLNESIKAKLDTIDFAIAVNEDIAIPVEEPIANEPIEDPGQEIDPVTSVLIAIRDHKSDLYKEIIKIIKSATCTTYISFDQVIPDVDIQIPQNAVTDEGIKEEK